MAWNSTFDTWGRIALAVGAWFKVWWRWLVVGLSFMGAFLLGIFLRPKPPGQDPAEATRKKAEDEAAKMADEIQRVAAEREKEVVVHATQAREDAVEEIAKDTIRIQDDVQHVNDYLRGVGDEMRKP